MRPDAGARMTALLYGVQRHRFSLMIVAGILLGVSLAFLGSVFLQFFLRGSSAEWPPGVQETPRIILRPSFQPVEVFESLLSGAFFREVGTGRKENPESTGALTLLGVVAGSDNFARAAVQMEGMPGVVEVRTGQVINGFQIAAIGSNYIIVERGSQRIRIGVGEGSGSRTGELPSKERPGPDVQRIVVSRDKLAALLANPAEMLRAKFAPITMDKKIVGIRLLLIPADHFLFEMGARTGDIVRRYNGQPVDSVEKMMLIFGTMKTANRATVEIERAGRIVPFEILVQ